MKRWIGILAVSVLATMACGAPRWMKMTKEVDPVTQAERFEVSELTVEDVNSLYQQHIASRVTAQVHQIIANLPPAGVSVAAMKAEIALAEKRMWEKMQAADVNNVRLLEQQMLLRERAAIDARLTEMEVQQ